jgi:hypothetical protein
MNKPLDLGHVRDEAGTIVRRELVGLQFDLRFVREAGIIADLRDAGLPDGRFSQWEWQRFEFHDNGGLVRRYSFNGIQIIDRFRDGRGAVRQEMVYGRFDVRFTREGQTVDSRLLHPMRSMDGDPFEVQQIFSNIIAARRQRG